MTQEQPRRSRGGVRRRAGAWRVVVEHPGEPAAGDARTPAPGADRGHAPGRTAPGQPVPDARRAPAPVAPPDVAPADVVPHAPPQSHGEDAPADPRLPRRLLVAGVLIAALATVSIVFLPTILAVLTPMGALVAFAAIVAGAVIAAAPGTSPSEGAAAGGASDRESAGDARPITCAGPRPVGELSRRAAGDRDSCGPGRCR